MPDFLGLRTICSKPVVSPLPPRLLFHRQMVMWPSRGVPIGFFLTGNSLFSAMYAMHENIHICKLKSTTMVSSQIVIHNVCICDSWQVNMCLLPWAEIKGQVCKRVWVCRSGWGENFQSKSKGVVVCRSEGGWEFGSWTKTQRPKK